MVLTEGNNDRGRIDVNTRVIAVDMPNTDHAESGWRNHRVTVDAIEQVTSFNLLSRIRNDIEDLLESRLDP